MTGGLRLALTTLTVARVRGPEVIDRRVAGQAMALAPLVGALLAAPVTAVALGIGRLTGEPLLAAALAVATLAALTRGLHLDGLADTADGLGSYLPAEQARRVMKQPDIGALGLAAVVLILIVQVAALAAVLEAGRGVGLGVALVTGRLAVTLACTPGTPAAAPDGLGAMVAGTVSTPVAFAVTALWALVAAVGDPLRGLAAVALGLLAAWVLRRHAVRRLGGLTGDVLGALVEVGATTALVVLAVG